MTKLIAMGRTSTGLLVPIAVDANGKIILSADAGPQQFDSLIVGNHPTNYFEVESNGTIQSFGTGTCFKDELQSVTAIRLQSPSGDFENNVAEASVTAKISARYPTDYLTTNWQLNHDWALGTVIFPHIHWWQTTTNTPNWIVAYRWQSPGQAKQTTWTDLAWSTNIFTWTAGTLNQITGFGSITPPAGYGQVSNIVQIRLYRDYTNVSTLFPGGDPVNASQDIVNLDVHVEVDMFGSREQYVK